MRCVVFSTHDYDRASFEAANREAGSPLLFEFHDAHLSASSAILASGADGVCAFVNDRVGAKRQAAARGWRLIWARGAAD